ncbi:MAG: hypothetical protein ACRC6V_02745, partial [Bacteroidales bacterium]
MITRKIVSFEQLVKGTGFWDTVCSLVHKYNDLPSVLEEISESEIHQIYYNQTSIGFFTKDQLEDDLIEVHAFIEPKYRKYS